MQSLIYAKQIVKRAKETALKRTTSPQTMFELLKGVENNIDAMSSDIEILEHHLMVLFDMVSQNNQSKVRAQLVEHGITKEYVDTIMPLKRIRPK